MYSYIWKQTYGIFIIVFMTSDVFSQIKIKSNAANISLYISLILSYAKTACSRTLQSLVHVQSKHFCLNTQVFFIAFYFIVILLLKMKTSAGSLAKLYFTWQCTRRLVNKRKSCDPSTTPSIDRYWGRTYSEILKIWNAKIKKFLN